MGSPLMTRPGASPFFGAGPYPNPRCAYAHLEDARHPIDNRSDCPRSVNRTAGLLLSQEERVLVKHRLQLSFGAVGEHFVRVAGPRSPRDSFDDRFGIGPVEVVAHAGQPRVQYVPVPISLV